MKEITQIINRLERTLASLEEEVAYLRQQLEDLRQELETASEPEPEPAAVTESFAEPEAESPLEPESVEPAEVESELELSAEPEPTVEPSSELEPELEPEPEPEAIASEPIEPEPAQDKAAPQSLADYYEQQRGQDTLQQSLGSRQFTDLQRSMSLNDRFRYQRELFEGDNALMNEVLTALADMPSYEEAVSMLRVDFAWDEELPAVADFYAMLQQYYS